MLLVRGICFGCTTIVGSVKLNLIYDGKATQKEIDRYTEKLGEIIGKVYGWDFPTPKKEREKDREER